MTPVSRVGHQSYENDPTGSSGNGGNNNNQWVCRHGTPTVPRTTLTAGQTTTLSWHFGAKHVGDCDVYLSYDFNRPRSTMRWFKIANFFDCRQQSNQEPQQITIPDWVPNGQAVLRWGWYALHQVRSIEFYSQCADVMISNPRRSTLPANVVTYPLINPPVFPLDSQNGEYPNRFGNAATNSWMVGPPCAGDLANSGVNQCYRTAPGTRGSIDVGGSNPNPPVTQPTTTTTSSTTQPETTQSTSGCPNECNTCQSGGSDDGGVAIVDGTCNAWCSQYGFCGASSLYQSGGTDCSGCANVVSTPGDRNGQECWVAGDCRGDSGEVCDYCGLHNGEAQICCQRGRAMNHFSCPTTGYNSLVQGHQCVVPLEEQSTTTTTTTTTVDTIAGSVSNRCGTNWVHANNQCGTPCVYSDSACPNGQRCFAGMTLACPADFSAELTNAEAVEEDIDESLFTCVIGWELREDNADVPSNWCQTTCSSESTQAYCDQDLCQCIVSSTTTFMVIFTLLFGILQL